MKILHLTLKKEWFDMILSGEKKEEYREMKEYWMDRFYEGIDSDSAPTQMKKYDKIIFKNGYAKNAPEMQIECKGISIGIAKPEWSNNWKGFVFIIRLGKILSTAHVGAVESN